MKDMEPLQSRIKSAAWEGPRLPPGHLYSNLYCNLCGSLRSALAHRPLLEDSSRCLRASQRVISARGSSTSGGRAGTSSENLPAKPTRFDFKTTSASPAPVA